MDKISKWYKCGGGEELLKNVVLFAVFAVAVVYILSLFNLAGVNMPLVGENDENNNHTSTNQAAKTSDDSLDATQSAEIEDKQTEYDEYHYMSYSEMMYLDGKACDYSADNSPNIYGTTNSNEKLYYLPKDDGYRTSDAEKWFCTEKQAIEDGWRRATE